MMQVLAFMPPPEISDDDLAKIGPTNPTVDVDRLLRERRCPPEYATLHEIRNNIEARMRDLHASGSFSDHIAGPKLIKRWSTLLAIADGQLEWMRRQVRVGEGELRRLMTRWLIIRFGGVEMPKMTLDGFEVANGIIKPKAGSHAPTR